MSKFLLLSANMSLWDPSTKAMWRLLDFCPVVAQFVVHTGTHRQLTALFQAGAWGDVEKPHQDMAFILIVPTLAIGLTAMWMHPTKSTYPPW